MIRVIGTALYQWDTGRFVGITDIEADKVHFANKGDSKAVIMDISNSQAKIPDYLLQTGKQLCVYVVKNGSTVETKTFSVGLRERPENYVYEDDQRNYIYELIQSAEVATEAATLATESANNAAQNASASAGNADRASSAANQAAEDAQKASDNANEAATKAAQTAKSLMVVGKAEGSNIYLDDAIDQFVVGGKIYGKTTQDGTPTPDAPVDLVSVGDSGSVGVFVAGKNLLDLSSLVDRSQAGVTITNNKNGSITLVSDGTYTGYYNSATTVSAPSGKYKFVEPSSSRFAFVRLSHKGESTYKQYNAGTVFEYDNITQEMKFYVQYDPGAKVNVTFWPMICIATETDTTYEPYKAQSLTVSTPNGLHGIPVPYGGNYTDSNGQQWVCDERDFTNCVRVQRIGVIESYACEEVAGAYMSSTGELSEGASVQYILNTPVETPMSDEEISAFNALHTYRGNTTVSNDASAHMEIEYVMDAKKYIDKVIGTGGVALPWLTWVSLPASKWVGSDSLYSQVVTINGVTPYSKVDLLPSVEQLAIFHNKDVAFVTENENGVVTVYAIGDKPLLDYNIQAQITEVAV